MSMSLLKKGNYFSSRQTPMHHIYTQFTSPRTDTSWIMQSSWMTRVPSWPYPESVFLTPLSHLFSWRIYFFNSLSFFWRRSPPHFHFNGLQLSLLFLPHGMNDFAENWFGGVCVSASGFQTHPITNIKEVSHSQVARMLQTGANLRTSI